MPAQGRDRFSQRQVSHPHPPRLFRPEGRGVDENVPITCKISGVPLRSALTSILDDLQLKWVIHNNALTITTPVKAESDEYMETKCYDVTDLIIVGNDHDLQYPLDPFTTREPSTTWIMGNGMGMGGNMARGGELFQPQYNFQPLEDLITNTVSTKSWADNGGTGTMSNYPPAMLVISQTQEVHAQIKDLLAALRARRQVSPVISVELHWLWLDARQRDRLLGDREKSSGGRQGLTIDGERLRLIADEVPSLHGQVACMNGMTTNAGRRRPAIDHRQRHSRGGLRRHWLPAGHRVAQRGCDGPGPCRYAFRARSRSRSTCRASLRVGSRRGQPAIVAQSGRAARRLGLQSPPAQPPVQKPANPGQPAPAAGGGFFQMGLPAPAAPAPASTPLPTVSKAGTHGSQEDSARAPSICR